MTFQDIILRLQHYWSEQGCLLLQPYDAPMGAGTFHYATSLWALGSQARRVCYVQPCRRPADGRYGDNPHRLQHYYQLQVLLKPSPSHLLPLYEGSLRALGLEPKAHDLRLIEDDWESPTLNAWGLGWEVWCDGMEITQLTYFQQVGGFDCTPVSLEITYGLERLALYLQKKKSVYDLDWDGRGTLYGDLFHAHEREYSFYNFDYADVASLHREFADAESLCGQLLARKPRVVYPAWDWCLRASHCFNVLDARGVLGVHERQAHIGRVRDLARACAQAWLQNHKEKHNEHNS